MCAGSALPVSNDPRSGQFGVLAASPSCAGSKRRASPRSATRTRPPTHAASVGCNGATRWPVDDHDLSAVRERTRRARNRAGRLDRRAAELASSAAGPATAALKTLSSEIMPAVQAIGQRHAGDYLTAEQLGVVVKGLSAIATELRPLVRHVPKPPSRPATGAPLANLMTYQAEQSRRLAQEGDAL